MGWSTILEVACEAVKGVLRESKGVISGGLGSRERPAGGEGAPGRDVGQVQDGPVYGGVEELLGES